MSSLFYSTPMGGYGYQSYNMMNSLVGRPFFYNDEEVGIGWESKIDQVWMKENHAGYILELSCGTRVEIDGSDVARNNYKVFTTNLKD